MSQPQTHIAVRVDPGAAEDRSAMFRWSAEQAGLDAWTRLPVMPSAVLTTLHDVLLRDFPEDDLLVFLDGSDSLCVRRFYEPGHFSRTLHQAMENAAADVLLASCFFCHPATARLVATCDRQFGRTLRNRYLSADGWVARVGALRRLVRRHGERSLYEARWWAEVVEVNWTNYGNQPRIVIDHACQVFQPLDEMVRELAPAPFSLINTRTGEHPVFLQKTGSAGLGPWMEMLWPSGPPSWERFNGEYEKQFYDVVLDSGEVLVKLWPNGGMFVDASGDDRTVPGERVVWMRPRLMS